MKKIRLGPYQLRLPRFENYNITPGQNVPVVKNEMAVAEMKWGLVPFWSKEPKSKYSMINARAETVQGKPSFRQAYQQRRCVVLASGFYEWKKAAGGKQPYYISPADDDYFCFAGLWERWIKDDESLETFAIITTAANEKMKELHDRMPVILDSDQAVEWIAKADARLLKPCQPDKIEARPVGKRVNHRNNNDPELIESTKGGPH